MLYSSMPLPFINTAINPEHLSIALSQIIDEVSFVKVARPPAELSIPIFYILLVIPNVFIAITIDPAAFTIPFSIFKQPLEHTFLLYPFILTFTFWFSIQVIPNVLVTTFE